MSESIDLPEDLRERLRKYGLRDQSDAEIIRSLMDRVDYEEFMEGQYARLRERDAFVPLDEA